MTSFDQQNEYGAICIEFWIPTATPFISSNYRFGDCTKYKPYILEASEVMI